MDEPSVVVPPSQTSNKRHGAFVDFVIRLVTQKKLGAVGGLIVVIMLLAGIFANIIAPYGMNELHMDERFSPPFGKYVLGTDNLGRDMLSRIIFGARVSVIIGLSAGGLGIVVGAVIGITSGYLGGAYDLMLQRFVDTWICFPSLIIYLTLMSLFGGGMLQIILVLGIGGGISASRLMRSYAIGLKNSIFIQASQAEGATTKRIVLKHLLPNIMPIIIINFTLSLAGVILAEASLSFLGLGLPPDVSSWGGMLSGTNRLYMESAPWLVIWPGVALSLTVYSINMFGDAVRDLLDPRLRGGVGGMGERGTILARKELQRREKKSLKPA